MTSGKFVDVSEEAGIYGSLIGFWTWSYALSDINGDLYRISTFQTNVYDKDYLYIIKSDGPLRKEIEQ